MIDVKFTSFFDKPGVMAKVNAATRKVLSKAGAFIRTRAKSSIRKRKKTATPGNPPSSHTGLLRKMIFFQYDPQSESVVVGPKLFRTRGSRAGKTGPELLERGGDTTTWRNQKATYQKFPFMVPALDKERDQFASLFADSVK